MQDLHSILLNHRLVIDRINQQRRWWLYFSSLVYAGIIIVIFLLDWKSNFSNQTLWWVIISGGLLIAVNWWYWTMRLVANLLFHQQIEIKLLAELVEDITDVKSQMLQFQPIKIDKHRGLE